MAESPIQFILNVARSRPFLLFVILVLFGFLYIQYMDSRSAIAIIEERPLLHVSSAAADRTNTDPLIDDSISNDSTFLQELGKIEKQFKASLANTKEPRAPTQTQSKFTSVLPSAEPTWRSCEKQYNVSFLKVHKAGSTTVMNIFLRFAIQNNLNIVLPAKSEGFGFNYLGYGQTLDRKNIVPLPNGEQYNVLCNHVVYKKKAFRAVMPSGTKYIGILREPRSHFISASTYYGFYRTLKRIQLEEYNDENINIVSKYLENPKSFKLTTYYVHNRMSFDFGIPSNQFDNLTFVGKYIVQLDEDYELVMIMEHFFESLVLLKRVLCWSTKDILYVPLNAMKQKPDFHLSEEDDVRLEFWNRADYTLYDHYLGVFKAKVQAQGQDFQDEVKAFKSIQEKVQQFCSNIHSDRFQRSFVVQKTNWGETFEVTVDDCNLMKESELSMLKRLIKNAWKRYYDSKS